MPRGIAPAFHSGLDDATRPVRHWYLASALPRFATVPPTPGRSHGVRCHCRRRGDGWADRRGLPREGGRNVLLCEKEPKVGGLVNSFERGGFVFDGGIRAIESSGIVFPMLRQLGIDIEFLPSTVSIGIGDDVVKVSTEDSLADYQALLERQFPGTDGGHRPDHRRGAPGDGATWTSSTASTTRCSSTSRSDPKYLVRTILPWMLRYALTMPKVNRLMGPVDEHLAKFSQQPGPGRHHRPALLPEDPDLLRPELLQPLPRLPVPPGRHGDAPRKDEGVHPRPRGRDPDRSRDRRRRPRETHAARRRRRIAHVAEARVGGGPEDALPGHSTLASIHDGNARRNTEARQASIAGARGGDSIYTLFLSWTSTGLVLEDRERAFLLHAEPARGSRARISSTRRATGLSRADIRELAPADPSEGPYTRDKARIVAWTRRYFDLTTYEISCPALRDPSLAPAGKTGLIVSTLMEHALHRARPGDGVARGVPAPVRRLHRRRARLDHLPGAREPRSSTGSRPRRSAWSASRATRTARSPGGRSRTRPCPR